MKYLIFLLSSLLFLSYSNVQIINPILLPIDEATIGVKSKIFYPSLDSNQILKVEDFEYNNQDQLTKKTYYKGDRRFIINYEIFKYNNSILIRKLNYHSNVYSSTGFLLLDSTIYVYSANLLYEEKIIYPQANYFDHYNFEYDGKLLIKKSKFHRNVLESYSTYTYENDMIHREVKYFNDDSIIESKEYKYKDVTLIEIYYTFNDEPMRKINYSYNENGMMVLEEVEELSIFSSQMSYVVKYEY